MQGNFPVFENYLEDKWLYHLLRNISRLFPNKLVLSRLDVFIFEEVCKCLYKEYVFMIRSPYCAYQKLHPW